MADFFKGLSGGLQTGLQFGQALREREMRDELAKVYEQPVSDLSFTPEQMAEMRRRQLSGAYDIEGVPGAEGQTPTLRYTPKQGLELGQGEMPDAPTEFAPQQVQRYRGTTVAGQFDPIVLQGLQMREAARIVGAYGDPTRAAQLNAEATRMEREAKEAPLRLKQLEQQGILTQGQIEDRERVRTREKGVEAIDTDVAQWMSKRLTGPDGEVRQPSMDDNIAQLQYRATALQKAGYNKEATDSLKDYQTFAVNQITLDDKLRTSQLGAVAAALATGDLGPARAFYDRFVLDGAKVTDMKTDPKTGAITVTRVRDDGTPLPDRVIKGGTNELLASLNSFRDPMALYNFSQNEFNNNLKLEELGLRKQTEARLSRAENTSAVEKNLAALKRLGISVTDAQIKTMVLGAQKDPALEAELAAITKIAGSDTANPKVLEALPGQIQAALARSKARETAAAVVTGLTKAEADGKTPEAIAELRKKGMPEADIKAAATAAGVSYAPPSAPTQPTTAPAQSTAATQPQAAAPAAPQQGLVRSVQQAVSGDSPAMLGSIRDKIQRGLPLSGSEQIIALRNNLIPTR